jgi:hypothetical protein
LEADISAIMHKNPVALSGLSQPRTLTRGCSADAVSVCWLTVVTVAQAEDNQEMFLDVKTKMQTFDDASVDEE